MRSRVHDLYAAARSLRRSPLTSCSIVVTLGVCIGAVAAMYSLVDAVLIRALPFDHPERLVWISSVSRDRPDRPFSLPELMDYRARATSIRVAAYANWSAIVEGQGSDGAQRLQGMRMTADGLAILGARPTVGRSLVPDDDAPTAARVVMLGYGYWRRALGGDPDAVGRALTLNGEKYTIVGVLPRFFPLPLRDIDVLVPLDPERDPLRNARGSVNFLRAFGRIVPTTAAAGAERELSAIAARLREQFPTEYAAKIGVRVTPLQQYLVATQRPTLVILMACVGLMVAIALVNVLNLLLARAVARQGESAVRAALGASTWQLGAHFLGEGLLLVAASGVLGVGLAYGAVSYAASHPATFAPRVEEARLSASALGVMFAVCAVAALLFSLVPLLISRTVSPQTALRGTGRSGTASPAQARMRSTFVIAELALAVVITSATAALTQRLMSLERVDLGYRPDSVFVARLSLPPKRYLGPADIARFALAMETALAAEPAVKSAGGTSSAPLSGVLLTVPFAPAQHAPPLRRDWPSTNFRAVTPGYFAAIGARVLAGRSISHQDDAAGLPIAVVNRALAEQYFPPGAAIGSLLLVSDNNAGPRPLTIVGVVDNVREVDLDGPMLPEVFISLAQIHADAASLVSGSQVWAIRVRGGPGAFAPLFMRVLNAVDVSVATGGLTDLRRYVDVALSPRRFSVALLVAFTVVALALTMIGIYGITADSVEQRRREIGVRMALGATPAEVVGLVLSRSVRVASIGIALGLTGSYLAGGFISRLMFGVSPGDPALLAGVTALLLATAIVASWVPCRRAARIDTLRALSD